MSTKMRFFHRISRAIREQFVLLILPHFCILKNTVMRYMLAIVLNGIAQIEYDRNRPLALDQSDYLKKMDEKMTVGIAIGEQQINDPNEEQRAKFVASNLYHAIRGNNEAIASAMTSYLAVRLPALKQVRIEDKNDEVSIELIYDNEYKSQIGVTFNG